VDREQRQELYSKISFIAYEEVRIYGGQHNVRNVFRDWVKGYSVNPMMYWYIPFHKIKKNKYLTRNFWGMSKTGFLKKPGFSFWKLC
jgi:ABC-type transport system substrate-binding protein